MELIDLTLIWIVIIAIALFMYVLMDGFDLGVGILYPFAPSDSARDDMMNSVAPVWDGNETWLILAGTGLLAAFPVVYTVLLPALYIGVFLLLAGLIFRGVAFEFRFKASNTRYLWDRAFNIGSILAAFAQGAVVGSYIQGFETDGFTYVGGPLDWLTPFTVMTGLGVIAGYALLGATWTILKTEGETQAWAHGVAPRLLLIVMMFFLLVSAWTPLTQPQVFERWLAGAHILWIFPAATLLTAAWIISSLGNRRELAPFVGSMILFVLFYIGLLISKWPLAVPPDHTFWDAASDPGSQLFLLIGILLLIPVIMGYTAWIYWVFRGKVQANSGYH